jgi:NADPH-dependent ferric siderophore reductase
MNSHSGDLQPTRVRHELHVRDLDIVRVEQLSKNFVSVTLSGPQLAGFTSLSFDDHIKIMITTPDGDQVRRDYTPRAFDAEKLELTIEFALHEKGYASDWAKQVAVGQHLTIAGPRGSTIIPKEYAWHLLIGDSSALPAIHRRIDELPANARVMALIQIDDENDKRDMQVPSDLTVIWVTSADELLSNLIALALPLGNGFIWCAGEAQVMATAKHHIIHDKQHPARNTSVASYWKRGAADFHEKL